MTNDSSHLHMTKDMGMHIPNNRPLRHLILVGLLRLTLCAWLLLITHLKNY